MHGHINSCSLGPFLGRVSSGACRLLKWALEIVGGVIRQFNIGRSCFWCLRLPDGAVHQLLFKEQGNDIDVICRRTCGNYLYVHGISAA